MSNKSPMDPDQLARMAATKALPTGLSHVANAGFKAYDVNDAYVSTAEMVDTLAGLLGRDHIQLQGESSLVKAVRSYHDSGASGEDAALEVATDVATDVGALALGPAGMAVKGAIALNNFASEKVETNDEKLATLYRFATANVDVTTDDVLTAIKAKAADHDLKMIAHLEADSSSAALDKYVRDYVGELADGKPADVSTIQFIADEINAGNLEKAVLVLDNPERQAPLTNVAAVSEDMSQRDTISFSRDTSNDVDAAYNGPATIPFSRDAGKVVSDVSYAYSEADLPTGVPDTIPFDSSPKNGGGKSRGGYKKAG